MWGIVALFERLCVVSRKMSGFGVHGEYVGSIRRSCRNM